MAIGDRFRVTFDTDERTYNLLNSKELNGVKGRVLHILASAFADILEKKPELVGLTLAGQLKLHIGDNINGSR